jgi:TRAP-type C4-dicarboxylate transport system permease small subunit
MAKNSILVDFAFMCYYSYQVFSPSQHQMYAFSMLFIRPSILMDFALMCYYSYQVFSNLEHQMYAFSRSFTRPNYQD